MAKCVYPFIETGLSCAKESRKKNGRRFSLAGKGRKSKTVRYVKKSVSKTLLQLSLMNFLHFLWGRPTLLLIAKNAAISRRPLIFFRKRKGSKTGTVFQ